MIIKLKFAEIVISVEANHPEIPLQIPPVYQQFLTNDQPDITVNVDLVDSISLASAQRIFQSGGNWDLYAQDDKWLIPVYSPPGTPPFQVAVFDRDFRKGLLLIDRNRIKGDPFYPLAFPLDELLMINFLGQERGVVLHSCAIKLDGLEKGLLFAGMSEAGKSTLTRLWQKYSEAAILSDDRVILRKKADGFWIYGTPWHGDAVGASPSSVKLNQLFVLKQSPHNYLTRLSNPQAAAKLMARCFPPFWDAAGVASTLELFDDVCRDVPCYEFGFIPDMSAIEFILQHAV